MPGTYSQLITPEKSPYGATSARCGGVNLTADAGTNAFAERCLR